MSLASSLDAPTREEARWLSLVKLCACLCCEQLRPFRRPRDADPYSYPMSEAHHLLSGGIRIGHLATVPLCMWHHRARLLVDGRNHAWHRLALGPSLLEGSEPFHSAWGDDARLLELARAAVRRLEATL